MGTGNLKSAKRQTKIYKLFSYEVGIPMAILPNKTIPSDQQKAYQIIIIKLKHAIA